MRTGTTQEGQWGQEPGTMRTRIKKKDNEDKNNTRGTMRTRTTQEGQWGQEQPKGENEDKNNTKYICFPPKWSFL